MQILKITDAAAERIKNLISSSDIPMLGLRVGVKNGGCAGMEYTIDRATELKPLDEVVEEKGVKIFIDGKAVLFLLGSVMDYKQQNFGASFVFENPNQTGACGCGESVSLKPAKM